jgi:hypothetical protein
MDDLDDEEIDESFLVARTTSKQGRSRGQSNFKVEEDIKLASSYAFVTTNAAIGTDQDGATFWDKIRANFVKRGGGAHRTTNSLQNRFNKVLQAEVNKYIGFLQSALREYHSGWVMEDYVCEAKKKYQIKFGKIFKHEAVHLILKKSLPKYEIVISSCDARVGRALFFLNVDNRNDDDSRGSALEGADSNIMMPAGVALVDDIRNSSLVTPRPTIGKKKAKLMEFVDRCRATGHKTTNKDILAATAKVEFDNAAKIARNNSLNRLAAAAEAKNLLVREQLMFQLFMQDPNSVQSKSYFDAMGQRYMSQLDQFSNQNSTTAAATPGSLPEEEVEVRPPAQQVTIAVIHIGRGITSSRRRR